MEYKEITIPKNKELSEKELNKLLDKVHSDLEKVCEELKKVNDTDNSEQPTA